MFKKLIAPVAVGGVLLGSLAMGGVASAATPTSVTTPAAHVAGSKAHRWVRAHRKGLRAEGLDISATTIGITPQALKADLQSGKSIAQVASANGSSGTAVESALTSAADAFVNKAQSSGKLTAARASAVEARLPARIDKIVNHVF
jgi:hypothetical protein